MTIFVEFLAKKVNKNSTHTYFCMCRPVL